MADFSSAGAIGVSNLKERLAAGTVATAVATGVTLAAISLVHRASHPSRPTARVARRLSSDWTPRRSSSEPPDSLVGRSVAPARRGTSVATSE